MNGINRAFGKLEFVEIVKGAFKKDSVHLMQTVTTTYPGGRGGNSKQDNLFGDDAFGDGQSFTSDRHCLVACPKGTTDATAKAMLRKFPQARIYRVLSHNVEDVLTDEQRTFSSKTLDEYRDDLRVKDADGNDLPGTPIYRQLFFSQTAKEDIDLRGVKPATPAVQQIAASEKVVEELAG